MNTLLDFTRIEAGRAQASFAPVDLPRLTAELASTFRAAVENAGLRLSVDCPPLPEPLWVDRDLWEKIVLNLLSNAFKFTFEGEIAVALRPTAGGAELEVRDTGVGIAQSELPRLFERFHRIQNVRARTHEGTGIGLAFVRELVRMHGGTIAVESAPGQGTAFRIRLRSGTAHLPTERLSAEPDEPTTRLGTEPFVEEASHWSEASVAPPGRDASIRLLIADDNADMREYLARLLSTRWTVEAVADGEKALASARRAPPSLVLADVMMPGLDGFGLLRGLREDEATRGIPFLMLSARAGEEARIEGIAAGADDYVVKPFSARELIAKVSSQLALARAREVEQAHRRELLELFRQAPFPICVLAGERLVFEMANPHYRWLVGGREVVGKSLLEALPELEGQGLEELLHGVMRTGEPFVGRERAVMIDREGHGTPEETFFTFTYAPLSNPDGVVDRVMVFCIDATDQVVARRELEAASRAKDEFLALLGHELRNPLAPILTALQVLRLKGGKGPQREHEVIERQVGHMVQLVDDLLDVSRVMRGKIQLKREKVELGKVLARAVEMASPLLEEKNHRLSLELGEGLRLEGDAFRLAQVFSNLLTNAAKYSPPGSEIAIAARREEDRLRVSVQDNGMGIEAGMLERIFEPFLQGERDANGPGGLGLGLPLVRSLLKLHEGRVSARSGGQGQGSEFVVELPALGAHEPIAVAEEEGSAVLPTGGGTRVLLVDDNLDAAEMIGEALELYGFEVRIARDGPEALAAAPAFHPELAVLDIGLPVMDGYELAERLRQLLGERITLFALTGYGQATDRLRTRKAGFAEHFVKPVDLDKLATALDRHTRSPAASV